MELSTVPGFRRVDLDCPTSASGTRWDKLLSANNEVERFGTARQSAATHLRRLPAHLQGLTDFAVVHSYLDTATKWEHQQTSSPATTLHHRRMATTSPHTS
jgi:hypothetical protein